METITNKKENKKMKLKDVLAAIPKDSIFTLNGNYVDRFGEKIKAYNNCTVVEISIEEDEFFKTPYISIVTEKREINIVELIELRKQIRLGSLFIADYRNSLNIDENSVCTFFDGYLEYLEEIMQEDGINDSQFWDRVAEYDTTVNLIHWFECFEECPLFVELGK